MAVESESPFLFISKRMIRDTNGRFLKGQHWRNPKLYWNKEWLENEYKNKLKPANQIAKENGCGENNIFIFLKKFNIKTRTMREIRSIKKWGLSGKTNGMYNRKGDLNPNWKGGITPERQLHYVSLEWKKSMKIAWKRDNESCKKCGIKRDNRHDKTHCVHHIVGFANKELRNNINNLTVLCKSCHNFVHSKLNINKEFMKEVMPYPQ